MVKLNDCQVPKTLYNHLSHNEIENIVCNQLLHYTLIRNAHSRIASTSGAKLSEFVSSHRNDRNKKRKERFQNAKDFGIPLSGRRMNREQLVTQMFEMFQENQRLREIQSRKPTRNFRKKSDHGTFHLKQLKKAKKRGLMKKEETYNRLRDIYFNKKKYVIAIPASDLNNNSDSNKLKLKKLKKSKSSKSDFFDKEIERVRQLRAAHSKNGGHASTARTVSEKKNVNSKKQFQSKTERKHRPQHDLKEPYQPTILANILEDCGTTRGKRVGNTMSQFSRSVAQKMKERDTNKKTTAKRRKRKKKSKRKEGWTDHIPSHCTGSNTQRSQLREEVSNYSGFVESKYMRRLVYDFKRRQKQENLSETVIIVENNVQIPLLSLQI